MCLWQFHCNFWWYVTESGRYICKYMSFFHFDKVNMFLSKSANLSRGIAEIRSLLGVCFEHLLSFRVSSVSHQLLSLCLTRDETIKWEARQVKSNYGCKLIPRGMVLTIYRDAYAVCGAAPPKTSWVKHNACWRQMEIEQAGWRGVRDEKSQGIERWGKKPQKTKNPHLCLNRCPTGAHLMTSPVKRLNSRTEGRKPTDRILSAITIKVMRPPAGTVGARAGGNRGTTDCTYCTQQTLPDSSAGHSPGLWQNVKWLPGWVASGWTTTRPCHGHRLCFHRDGFLSKGHACR